MIYELIAVPVLPRLA